MQQDPPQELLRCSEKYLFIKTFFGEASASRPVILPPLFKKTYSNFQSPISEKIYIFARTPIDMDLCLPRIF